MQTAQDIEADLNRTTRSLVHQSTAHYNRSDQNRSTQRFGKPNEQKDRKPPYPCKHCRDIGITSHHWHNDCPNKPKEQRLTSPSDSTETSAQPDCNISEAKALVTPRLSGDQPILVKTFLKNKRIMAFVDTGANVNLMPESVVYEFRLTLDRHSARPVKTASGYAQTLGTVSFELTIDGITRTIDALVIRGFEYTLLLSRNTCHQFKLMIDTDLMSATTKRLSADCHQITDRSQPISKVSQSLSAKPQEVSSEHQPNDTIEPSIQNLMKGFPKLFASDSTDLGRIEVESHRILLSDNEPIAQRPYRQSTPDADETARQVTELLAKGLIRESVSPYAAPITLADKKDGSKRLCIDYRRLNKKTVADKTPLPLISDVIDRLQGSTIFTKLDFASAYWQIPVNSDDVFKTAFVTKDGHYEWLVLPYGLRNSPSTFHRVVRKILGDLVNKGVMSYLDDIVIYAENREQHDQLLSEVFRRLHTHNARLKLSKCEFARPSIEFLGHVINGTAVSPPLLKVKAITDFPVPTDRKAVERFHGLINYLREYIPNFAIIAEPLTRLLRKAKPFEWTEAQTKAFNQFKELLTNSPVRHIYNQKLDCELHTDASTVGIAAILIQSGHPIGYYSRKLSDAETRYTVTEQECLALVDGVRYFRIYLEGTKFKAFTDHIALKWLLKFDSTKKRLYRWSQELSNYDFEVIHTPGERMAHVDALSRAPVCLMISDEELLSVQKRDKYNGLGYRSPVRVISNIAIPTEALQIRSQFNAKPDSLSTVNRNGRELKVLPPSLVLTVLEEYHDNAGHPGVRKTCQHIRNAYFWPEMTSDIKTYVKSCHSCQLNKFANHSTFGQLQPLASPYIPLDLMSTDTVVIGNSAAKTSSKYLQVTLDHSTRYVWAKATKTNTTDAIISSLDCVFKSFGTPNRLLTDNATNYRSKKLKRFLTKLGIKRSFTTAFHPQTNGSNEKVNGTIVTALRIEMVSHRTYKWTTLVQKVVDNYNNTIHTTTGFTPAYLMFGKDRINTSEPSLTEARQQAKLRSDAFKANKKVEYDRKHEPLDLSIGDLVKRRIPRNHPNLQKLSPRYEAPLEVVSIEGPVNVIVQRLKLKTTGSLTPFSEPIRVHISQLEPYFFRTRSSEGGECGEPLKH